MYGSGCDTGTLAMVCVKERGEMKGNADGF